MRSTGGGRQAGGGGVRPRAGALAPSVVLRLRYTAWDGTQEVRLSADQVFERLSEYLSFTDDVAQAMDWLLHQGLEWQGVRVMGLDDFLEQLREEMRAHYRQVNLREAFTELR